MLYVASDNADPTAMCPGSAVAMDLIDGFREDVDVQDVDKLCEQGVSLPEWLDGTPCVVNTLQKLAYKGSDCLDHLRQHSKRGMQTFGEELVGESAEPSVGALPGALSDSAEERDNNDFTRRQSIFLPHIYSNLFK